MATVQKVYLTHPKYTCGKRPQTSLRTIKRPASRSVSLMNTPLHISRVKSGGDSFRSTPHHTGSGRDSLRSTPLHTRHGKDTLRSNPLHTRICRHRLCEDGCSQWRSDWDRQARQSSAADGKHMRKGSVSLANSPRRRKKKEQSN